jgi:hypothetical protein
VPQFVLIVAVIVILLVVSRRVRSFVFHPILLRTIITFIVTAFVALILGIVGYFGWQWWEEQQSRPTLQWSDTTVWQNPNPVTPGIERRPSTLKIQ